MQGHITKLLRELSKTFNIDGINYPVGKSDIKFEKLNNIKIHCLCTMTNSECIDHCKPSKNPDWILLLIKKSKGRITLDSYSK